MVYTFHLHLGHFQSGSWDDQRKERFEEVIEQMRAITELRHSLVHRGVERIKGEITSSNAVTAKSAASIQVLRFNREGQKRADDLLRALLGTPPEPFTPKPKRARKRRVSR